MSIRLLEIEAADLGRNADSFTVRVRLDVSGGEQWHDIQVAQNEVQSLGAALLTPSEELDDLLASHPRALGRICQIVGRRIQGVPVHLPQRVAA